MIFGSQPSKGVKTDTKMVYDLANAMDQGYDKVKLSLRIPEVFERLEGRDNSFESIQSNVL